jgi:hypothetical protein
MSDAPKPTRDIAAEVTRAMKIDDNLTALRLLCREYDEDELRKAIAYIPPPEQYEKHRKVIREEIECFRHKQIEGHLKDLKEPHWTLDHLYELVGIYYLEEAFTGASRGADPRS